MDKIKVFKAFKVAVENMDKSVSKGNRKKIKGALKEFELWLEACPHGAQAHQFCEKCDSE